MDAYKEIGGSDTAPATAASSAATTALEKGRDILTAIGSKIQPAWEKVSPCLPDLSKVYIEPLMPTPARSVSERYHLVVSSARPWSQFIDISHFNLPPASQLKSRFEHNVETYFYNYFILTLLHVALFSLFHLLPVFSIALFAIAAYLLLVQYPADIVVGDVVVLDELRKYVLLGVLALVVVLYGGGLTLLFSVAIFVAVLTAVHGLLRDDDDYVVVDADDV